MTAEPHPRDSLRSALLGSPDRVLVRTRARAWTAGQLLQAAAAQRSAVAGGAGPVGVSYTEPGLLLASMLAAWSERRTPILLDPSLRKELETLHTLYPGLDVLTEAPSAGAATHELAAELAAGAGPRASAEMAPWLVVPADEDPFVSLFTSGSEGSHKVVRKLGRQMYRQAAAVCEPLGLERGCRVLTFVPPFHLLGCFYGLVLPLVLEGETMVAVDRTGPAMVELVRREQPDLVVGTATHYRALVRAAGKAGRRTSAAGQGDLIPTTRFVSSGAPIDPTISEQFASHFGTPVREMYGATEVGGVAWRAWPAPYQPMPGARWRLEQDTGRLSVQSPWADGEDEPRWVALDDVAEAAEGGGFRLLGRLGHMMKVGGKRFSLVEVEHALRACPGVADAAALAFERYGEQAVAALVVAEPGVELEEAALRHGLAEQLASFKIPRAIRIVPALPRARLSKLDYAAARALLAEGPEADAS